jgi:ATP dependent DNA ligase domain
MADDQAAGPRGAAGPGGIPPWAQPQLATLTKDRFSDPQWLFERKLDGERLLAFRDASGVRLLTRNDRDVTTTFPEVADALRAQRADGFVVDGEVVAFRDGQTSFSMLQQRLGVAHPAPGLIEDFPVTYYIFDVLFAGGQDTRGLPQRLHRPAGLPAGTGRPPGRLLRRRRPAGLRGQGRDRVQHREPAQPARVAVGAGTRHLAVRTRETAAGGGALGRALAGRPDRVRRVDHRRPAPPAPVRGPARRQGPRRGSPREPGPLAQAGPRSDDSQRSGRR